MLSLDPYTCLTQRSFFSSLQPQAPLIFPFKSYPRGLMKKIVIFRHDVGSAVYDAFFGLDGALTNPPFRLAIFALAELDIWKASVRELLREKNCCGGRPKKTYSVAYKWIVCCAITHLLGSIYQFVENWNPNKLEVHIHSTSPERGRRSVFGTLPTLHPFFHYLCFLKCSQS